MEKIQPYEIPNFLKKYSLPRVNSDYTLSDYHIENSKIYRIR
jgi:hypothetical protein